MRTMKIKLPFAESTGTEERRSKLIMWADALLRHARLNILDMQHYGAGSYIIVENTYNEGVEGEENKEK